jgi:PhnB protein
MSVKPIPDEYHTITPYLIVHDVEGLMEFLERALDAREIERLEAPGGSIVHAEMRIGDSVVMMAEANEQNPPRPAMLHLYLEDADAAYGRALEAGATSLREPEDQFYGDRTAGVKDRFGNQWWLATHVEDVTPEEMHHRFSAMAAQG